MSFRMTVEEVFVIKNRGVVATGRVDSGVLRVGDTVNIGVLFRGIDKSEIGRGAVITGGGSDAAPFIV